MEPSSGFYWDPVLVLDFKGATVIRVRWMGHQWLRMVDTAGSWHVVANRMICTSCLMVVIEMMVNVWIINHDYTPNDGES